MCCYTKYCKRHPVFFIWPLLDLHKHFVILFASIAASDMFRLAATRSVLNSSRTVGRRNASTNVAVQNIESRWKSLSPTEQNTIAKQLEEAQKGDWKQLSLEEKKAACTLYLLW
jgi:hypothetical protein